MAKVKEKGQDCCETRPSKAGGKKGFLSGILYGLVPHTFCILFVVLSVIGATTGTLFFKQFLLIPYFFQLLVLLSFVFATISAVFYLRRGNNLNFNGLKRKWDYLGILYTTTIAVNLLFFFVVFPAFANIDLNPSKNLATNTTASSNQPLVTLKVAIPCSGHASLIKGELQTINGVQNITFRMPDLFDVTYDPAKTTENDILNLEVFKTYKATIVK